MKFLQNFVDKKGPLSVVFRHVWDSAYTEVHFKPSCFHLVNAANPHDQCEPVAKSAWESFYVWIPIDSPWCLSFAPYILTSPSASDFFIMVLQGILRNQQGFALKHVPNTNKQDNRQSPSVFVLLQVVCPLARAESFLYTFSPRLSWSAIFFVPLAPPHSLSTSHLFFTLFPCVYHPEVLNWITVWQHCKQNSCRRWLWRLSEP